MCLASLKYGHISHMIINRKSFKDFGANDDAAKEWAENVYGSWAKLYPAFIKDVQRSGEFEGYWSTHDPLSYYCGNAYYNANEYFRSKGRGNAYFDSLKTEIDNIIEGAPRIPENIVVYRALGDISFWDFKTLNGLQLPFVELGPMSTSLSASILTRKQDDPSSDFSACRYALKIFVPKGAKAIFIDEIAKSNEKMKRGEIELLFFSGSKLYMESFPYKQWGKTIVDYSLAL